MYGRISTTPRTRMTLTATSAPMTAGPSTRPTNSAELRGGLYRLGARVDLRGAVEWFDGFHRTSEGEYPVRVGREPKPHHSTPATPIWPTLAWEADVRGRAQHLGLPRIVDRFEEGSHCFLVLESPMGVSLWDAWDDPSAGTHERFRWLILLAESLRALHRVAAILESLRPENVTITPLGEVVLSADAPLLPLPLPAHAQVRPRLWSAPELILGGPVDARADLYHFGTLIYALELGRELSELDFDAPGELKSVLDRDPDLHPCLGRLLARTLAFERGNRFPSEDANDDLSGFGELVRTMERAQRTLGRARIDIAAWTTTGMVRGNNEDAAMIVHSAEMHETTIEDWACVALADGMGGNAAGEVAAALTVRTLRKSLLDRPPLGASAEGRDWHTSAVDSESIAERIASGLRDANRAVYTAARCDGHRGMGCTAEAVFVDGRQVIVGHVGDSRTYLFRRGELRLLTRDQTFLAIMLEQGLISPDDARSHPRRGELTQAIGGRADVNPEMVRSNFGPGDWLVVCSDGLTARLSDDRIREILQDAASADSAARRLVNRANAAGAADNVTVVVVRGC